MTIWAVSLGLGPIVSDSPFMEAWEELVTSMHDAISDPSQSLMLGCAIAVVIAIWVNYRLARWLIRKFSSPSVNDKKTTKIH